MESGFTFYTENAGLLSLREAIAGYYQRMQGVAFDPRREIVVAMSNARAIEIPQPLQGESAR
jgi:aspartate/methionine/tyrosine aminotransferase